MSTSDQEQVKAGFSASDSGSLGASLEASTEKQKRIFKIIVIGDSNVGKTCLTYRFCGGKFPDKTEATIGVDFREKSVTIEKESIKLQLWDTAGQERFRKSMVPHYYRNVHAVIFVYDMTKMATFEGMPGWIDECDRHSLSAEIPRILVGNKCDVRDRVQVPTSMAQKFADANCMPLFETSAKDEAEVENVSAIFMTLAHKLKNRKPMMAAMTLERSGSTEGVRRARVIKVGREWSRGTWNEQNKSEGVCSC